MLKLGSTLELVKGKTSRSETFLRRRKLRHGGRFADQGDHLRRGEPDQKVVHGPARCPGPVRQGIDDQRG